MIARVWAWCRRHPVLAFVALPLLLAVVVLWLLYRGAARALGELGPRAESAEGSARRTETLRTGEERARRDADAARAELAERERALEQRRDAIEQRREEARAEVDDARDDAALARILDERRKAGRLP